MFVCVKDANVEGCLWWTLILEGAAVESLRLSCNNASSMRGKFLMVPALVGMPTNESDDEDSDSEQQLKVPLTDPPTIQPASMHDRW